MAEKQLDLPVGVDGGSRSPISRLQTEEALHLVPDRDAEENAERKQHEQRHEEAEPGKTTCAPALDASPALRPLEPIRSLDRERIDGFQLVAR